MSDLATKNTKITKARNEIVQISLLKEIME